MNRVIAYFFGPIADKDGNPKPFSRFDMILGGAFILSAVLTIAYWGQRNIPMDSEDWHRICVTGGISVLLLLISRHRLGFLAAAAGFIGLRLVLSSLFFPSFDGKRAKYFVCGLGCLLVAWVIVKVSVNRS